MKRRKTELMVYNVILCMIVVLIHLLAQPLVALDIGSPLYFVYTALWRVSTFVVQAFVFLSGLRIFLNGREEKYSVFMIKRIKTTVVPYVAAVVIYYLYFVFVLKYFPFSALDCAGYILRGDVSAQFYFIILIVQFYLLYPLWKIVLNNLKPLYAMIASAVITIVCGLYSAFIIDYYSPGSSFMYTDRIFITYLVYWTGGIFAGKYYDRFIGAIKSRGVIITVLFVIFAAADIGTLMLNRCGIIKPLHLDMIHALYCVCAILFALHISYKFKDRASSFISVMDKSSYHIYLYHVLFIFILDNNIIGGALNGSLTLRFVVRAAVIFASCIALAYARSIVLKKDSVLKKGV